MRFEEGNLFPAFVQRGVWRRAWGPSSLGYTCSVLVVKCFGEYGYEEILVIEILLQLP